MHIVQYQLFFFWEWGIGTAEAEIFSVFVTNRLYCIHQYWATCCSNIITPINLQQNIITYILRLKRVKNSYVACTIYNANKQLRCRNFLLHTHTYTHREIHKHTCKWQYNCNKRLYCCYNKQASKALINSLPLCNRAINIDTHCCWSVHYHLQCFVACTKCARNEQRTSLNTFNSLQHQMHKSLERLVARGRCMRELSGEKIYAYCSFKLATVLLLLYKT